MSSPPRRTAKPPYWKLSGDGSARTSSRRLNIAPTTWTAWTFPCFTFFPWTYSLSFARTFCLWSWTSSNRKVFFFVFSSRHSLLYVDCFGFAILFWLSLIFKSVHALALFTRSASLVSSLATCWLFSILLSLTLDQRAFACAITGSVFLVFQLLSFRWSHSPYGHCFSVSIIHCYQGYTLFHQHRALISTVASHTFHQTASLRTCAFVHSACPFV